VTREKEEINKDGQDQQDEEQKRISDLKVEI
jgi:hypothetical protein